jgi:hypothetical protein
MRWWCVFFKSKEHNESLQVRVSPPQFSAVGPPVHSETFSIAGLYAKCQEKPANRDSRKCLQALPNVLWSTKSSLIEMTIINKNKWLGTGGSRL